MSDTAEPSYEIVIERTRGSFRLPWRELWAYRDLFGLLIRRDFISKYKQTILGPAWFILQPLLMTLVLAVIFGGGAQVKTDGAPYLLYFLCNLLGWNYFADNVNAGAAVFTTNAHLFGKVYFPRLLVPFSIVASNAFAFLLRLVMLFGFLFYYKFAAHVAGLHSTTAMLCVPLLALEIAGLSLGVSLWLSALSAKYRDLTHLTPVLLQLWFFASVVLSIANLPPALHWLPFVNPMLPIIEALRVCLLGVGHVTTAELATSALTSLLLLLTGLALFRRAERTVIDLL